MTIDKDFWVNDNHVMDRRAPKSKRPSTFLFSFISVAFVISYLCYFSTSPALAQTSPSIYWGVWAGGAQYGRGNAPFDMTTLDNFEVNAGKQVSIVRWGAPWKYRGDWLYFPINEMNKVRVHGSIPLLDWGSWALGNGESMTDQPDFQNAVVASGMYDSFIRQWADQAQAWGYPFFLRYNFEANGWWYSFQEGKLVDGSMINGNQPGDYIKAWRHVWNVFNCVDDGIFHPLSTCMQVTNATWTWTINIISTATTIDGQPRYPDLSQVYPGDEYVDWVGVSLYNRNTWSYSFSSLFTGTGTNWLENTYQLLSDIAPTKPMMITEFGSSEYYNDPAVKANWITDAIGTQIPQNFPRIKAILWYNTTDERGSSGTVIETSPEAQAAFKNAIANPIYSTNTFGNLLFGTKIQPLGDNIWTDSPTPSITPIFSPTPTEMPTNMPVSTLTDPSRNTSADIPTVIATDTSNSAHTEILTTTPTNVPSDTPVGIYTDTPTDTPIETPTTTSIYMSTNTADFTITPPG